jgi:hypothetical protein
MSQAARQLALNPTKGYKPKTQSQIPGPFFAILLRGVETEAFTNLKEGPKALYMLMPYYVMWNAKQRTASGNEYLSGQTRILKGEDIQEKFFPHKTVDTINEWLRQLVKAGLLARKRTQGNLSYFVITSFRAPGEIKEWEENATKRDIAVAEVAAEREAKRKDFAVVGSKPISDLRENQALLFNTEIKETSSSPGNTPGESETTAAPSSSSDAVTDQENQLFELWSLKHNKKYIPRGAFLKHLRKFEKVCQEWRDLEAEAAQRLLMSAIPKMPTHDKDGKSIGSPVWLIKDDRNYGLLQDGLKAEGVDIGHDVSEVHLVAQVDTKKSNDAQVATKRKDLISEHRLEGTTKIMDALQNGGAKLKARDLLESLRK